MASYGTSTAPLAIAHRGGAGLAPENTLTAFATARTYGLDHLETDVRLSADGVPMVFHDPTLRRLTGDRRRVADLTALELAAVRLPGDEHVPTLGELLLAQPDACLAVDVKEERGVAAVAATIAELGAAGRVCIAGGWDGWHRAARDLAGPDLSIALGWRGVSAMIAAGSAGLRTRWWSEGASFVHVPLRLAGVAVYQRRLVACAHDLGLRIIVWTSNDPDEMHRLLDDGVDGIITDRPDLLRDVMTSQGQAIPQPPIVARSMTTR